MSQKATEVQKDIIVAPKVYENPSAELHTAVITKVEDLGEVESDLYGTQEMVRISYKILDEVDSKGDAMFVSERMSKSLGERARLGKRLRSLGIDTNKPFNLAEIVDLKVNVGIIHTKKGDKTYANVDFTSLVKGSKVAATAVEEV